MTVFWLERAVEAGGVAMGVRLREDRGVIVAREDDRAPEPGDIVLRGVTLPGFANAHSHAFHRALRGRTHDGASDFWAWRRLMYRAVEHLDVETYRRLATAVYAEMVLAGYTAVGEFHYVHRGPGGRAYDDPNAMGHALMDAARSAGIRLTLLDTMYLRGGLDESGHPLDLDVAQRRFSDGGTRAWLARHRELRDGPLVRIGAAIHSVRAVDVRELHEIAPQLAGAPIHAHVSEQPAENAQSIAAYGVTPVEALRRAGVLGPDFTAVHATHLEAHDISSLAESGSTACFCPTTERDLADGVGPGRALVDAGVALAIGSDQHVVVDPFEELRALEGHERLVTGRRGVFSAPEMLRSGTEHGHTSLGWRAGRLATGFGCDLVTIDPRSVRTAGSIPDRVWTAAAAQDVRDVVIAGERVVEAGRHRLGDVGELLEDAIDAVFRAEPDSSPRSR